MTDNKKPTIAELEKIMDSKGSGNVNINPNGSITTVESKDDKYPKMIRRGKDIQEPINADKLIKEARELESNSKRIVLVGSEITNNVETKLTDGYSSIDKYKQAISQLKKQLQEKDKNIETIKKDYNDVINGLISNVESYKKQLQEALKTTDNLTTGLLKSDDENRKLKKRLKAIDTKIDEIFKKKIEQWFQFSPDDIVIGLKYFKEELKQTLEV